MSEKVVVPFRQYLDLQIQEALGPENMWFTGEEVGHEPNHFEAFQHYVDSGAAARFAQTHIRLEAIPANECGGQVAKQNFEPK
ncbi:MAG: hypothetical protein COX77_01080 [Candidatus Komeilibacteria bacterium CG_4_10_14_0_2_um_filter_37_10]|uniref:Uncharacterized protein n=1 Tax=Candidatus Komeilibacteria bacterium CG_4_10_14_0_2_um_filter_37_10 TaxID=1974470 RepID=A0A2M7VFW4_9BACT|nr:MAG: hypothetical protein COX77_01080 [Candidatus Komeilibacteria bacterium CG_4_10_14_0_2_um_filter_37_10]